MKITARQLSILQRIAEGKPAYATMLKEGDGQDMLRRYELNDLYSRGLLATVAKQTKTGKAPPIRGPAVTMLGRQVLELNRGK